ncbi:MAG TPA: hypothetical protein VGV68_08875 [Terriglobia bacterium]|nr:hypothetical protein [Terriglobia bacterium]
METVEKSKSQNDFPTVSTPLGNLLKTGRFPHSHSADIDAHLSTDKKITHPRRVVFSRLDYLLEVEVD